MSKLKLWYYIEGHPRYFSVFISPSETIDVLTREIYRENDKSLRCNAVDLTLTKVRYIMISM